MLGDPVGSDRHLLADNLADFGQDGFAREQATCGFASWGHGWFRGERVGWRGAFPCSAAFMATTSLRMRAYPRGSGRSMRLSVSGLASARRASPACDSPAARRRRMSRSAAARRPIARATSRVRAEVDRCPALPAAQELKFRFAEDHDVVPSSSTRRQSIERRSAGHAGTSPRYRNVVSQ